MNKVIAPGVEGLLALDGDRYFIDDNGVFEVVFKVRRCTETLERPHGLKYSIQFDHKHIGTKISPYKFIDTYTLVSDFWEEVDKLI